MSEETLIEIYKRKRDESANAEIARERRKDRINKLEAERQVVLGDMEESGMLNSALSVGKSVYATGKSIIGGGLRDAAVSSGGKMTEVVGWGFEKVMDPVLHAFGEDVFGMSRQQAGEMVEDFSGDIQRNTEGVKETIKSAPKIEMATTPEDGAAFAVENLSRSMVSFFALYGPALKIAGSYGKGRIAGDIYAGAVADMLAFENKEGTFSDLAREFGFDNELTRFLSGELSDNEFDASLKAALEGAGMGGMFWILGKTYRALRDGYNAHGLGSAPVSGSPAAQRGAVGDLTPTKSEKKYFDEIFANEADAKELLEAAPSARMEDGKFIIDPSDIEGFTKYMDETMALREGDRLPPSFYNDDFLRRIEADDVAPKSPDPSIDERIAKSLTEEERALMTPKDRTTMESLLSKSASAEEVASMAAAGGAKRGWYQESVKALRHVFGDDAERFAALLSATSPQTSVESNLRNAINVWKNWKAGGSKTDSASIMRIMGESVEGTKGEKSVLDAWKNNTMRALQADDPLFGLSGPKVDSFMRNLAGNMQEVTNDTWMARALGMSQSRDFSGRAIGASPIDEIGQLDIKKPGYLAANILTREAADIMTKATGEAWTPANIQETVWSWAKSIYEAKGAAGETRNIPQILQSGDITDDIIRDTPDFATLFGQKGEFRDLLEGAGYAEQIKNLPESSFGQGRATSSGAGQGRDLSSSARRLDRTSRSRRGTERYDRKGRVKDVKTAEDLYQYARGLVRRVSDSTQTPGTFRPRNLRDGTGSLKGDPVTQFSLSKERKAEMQALNVPTPALSQFDNPQKFHDFVAQSKANAGDNSGFLTLYSPEEYADMRTFVTSDGSAGFAIKSDGDIVSVFNNTAGPHSGLSPHLISLAIEQGGKKLDAYDGILRDIYGDMGFVEVKRDKWNADYMPDDWNIDRFGEPDVIYMELE